MVITQLQFYVVDIDVCLIVRILTVKILKNLSLVIILLYKLLSSGRYSLTYFLYVTYICNLGISKLYNEAYFLLSLFTSELYKYRICAFLSDKKDVEMKKTIGHFTLEVIGACAFGIKGDSLSDENAHFFTVSYFTTGAHT